MTVSVLVQVAVLLAASFTAIVTVCGPLPVIVEPAAGFCVMINASCAVQLSLAATSPIISGTVAWQLASASTAAPCPQLVIVGAAVSLTAKVRVHVAWLLAASVTVTVTDVLPRPTIVPAAGL